MIKDIFDGPEFFTCEHFKTRMLKKRCVERQEGNYQLYSEQLITAETGLSIEYCKTCEQGKRIRDEIILVQPKPQRGKGDRKESCLYYSDCLNRAAKRNWKTFNCENCSLYKPGPEIVMGDEKKNIRICETDGCENITLNPNCPLCPKCMAQRSNDNRGAKKTKRRKSRKSRTTGKQKDEAQGMPKDEKASPGLNTALTIDFGKYGSVLTAIKRIAEEELRPIDMQIVYMLKRQLDNTLGGNEDIIS